MSNVVIINFTFDGSVWNPDSKNLRKNLIDAAGGKKPPLGVAAHHIVGKDTPTAAAKMKAFGIDVDDANNGVFLPTSKKCNMYGPIHNGRHGQEYRNTVELVFQNVENREDCLDALEAIKQNLLAGYIPLYD